jgi:hypothetical protein
MRAVLNCAPITRSYRGAGKTIVDLDTIIMINRVSNEVPPGVPRLTNKPFLTINGILALELVSISGTSACQPWRSFPLKRLTVCPKLLFTKNTNVISAGNLNFMSKIYLIYK